MSVAVRVAEANDAPRIVQIYVDSWNAGFGELMPHLVIDEDRISRWTTELTTGPTRWWVAEHDGSIVGFVGIGPSRDPVDPELGELDTIAVDPAHWRGGTGTALMRTALDALADSGFTEAILWTLAGYDQGQTFYSSMGWTADGRTRDNGHQVSYRHDLGRSWPDQ
jgi:N-acetylglutamate synthase-like GNAT family acetyltransferase